MEILEVNRVYFNEKIRLGGSSPKMEAERLRQIFAIRDKYEKLSQKIIDPKNGND
jgi:hypothetical protein